MKGRTHLVDGWHYHGTTRCWRAFCGFEFTDGTLAQNNENVCRNCERAAKRSRCPSRP